MENPARAHRQARGLSLKAAARQLGIHHGNLSRVERGQVGFSLPLALKVRELYQLSDRQHLSVLYPGQFDGD